MKFGFGKSEPSQPHRGDQRRSTRSVVQGNSDGRVPRERSETGSYAARKRRSLISKVFTSISLTLKYLLYSTGMGRGMKTKLPFNDSILGEVIILYKTMRASHVCTAHYSVRKHVAWV